MASVSMGNIVPRKTVNAAPRKRRLLNINALSLEMIDSNWFSLSSSFERYMNTANENRRINAINPKKSGPMSDCAKEWTEEIMPLRINFAWHLKSWSGIIKSPLLVFAQGCFVAGRTALKMLHRIFFRHLGKDFRISVMKRVCELGSLP